MDSSPDLALPDPPPLHPSTDDTTSPNSPWPVVLDDPVWMSSVPACYTKDEDLAARLLAICHQPSCIAHNENQRKTLQGLLDHGVVVDCESQGLARYIADTLLNYNIKAQAPSPPAQFRLVLGSGEDIAIDPRSRLVLWHLSRRLKVTIVLVSTRARPHVFAPEYSHAVIGFLHRIDSYHGTSEFLVLNKARTPPLNRMIVDPLPAPVQSHPAATVRTEGKRAPQRREVSKDACRDAIEYAW